MPTNQEDRYRQAAEDALHQPDWCIGYLHGIHKPKVSNQLARNRTQIRRNLLKESTEPVPSETTSEA